MNQSHPRRTPFTAAAPIILLILAGLFAWGNSLQGVFVFDDLSGIDQNPAIESVRPLSLFDRADQRPVTRLTLAVNFALGGRDPLGYHLGNITIHLIAGVLLYLLTVRTLRRIGASAGYGDSRDRRNIFLAFATALLWLVHPLQTQSVTYLVQRHESLAGMFSLLVLLAVDQSATDSSRRWQFTSLGIAWVACLLAMGSKQVAVVIPLVAVLYDRMFLAGGLRSIPPARLGVYLGMIPLMIWTAWDPITHLLPARSTPAAVTATGQPDDSTASAATNQTSDAKPPAAVPGPAHVPSAGFEFDAITPREYLRSQPGVIVHYLRLAAWPDRLCLDWLWPIADSSRKIVLPALLVTGGILLSVVAVVRGWAAGFAGLSFFLLLAPTSSFLPIKDLAVEHRMYLPLACVVVLAVTGLATGLQRLVAWMLAGQEQLQQKTMQVAGVGLLLIVAGGLMLRTIERNRDYFSPIAFWQSTVDVAPWNARARANLGQVLLEDRQSQDAVRHLKAALELSRQPEVARLLIRRDRALILNNSGNALLATGRIEEAAESYRAAVDVDPAYGIAWHNLANARAIGGQYEAAEKAYDRARQLEPRHWKIPFDRGNLHAVRNELEAALTCFRTALELDPTRTEVRITLCRVLLDLGREDEAAAEFRRILPQLPQQTPQAVAIRRWLNEHARSTGGA